MRVRTPVDAFQEPVISGVLEKARTSSADWKPLEMVTMASWMLVSSSSVMVREFSINLAVSFSVYSSVPPAPEMTGAITKSLTSNG